ncbi:unnamed protein product [Albugo candida]|uniref:Uncharacterized protein n=1 Tax=Albugo candida TaxID=65357 RepID=A0A024GT85_9STRA|nr:unnamed protein product [Albugo candida]|eukprot:CCI49566.1 unnamed protein product [Albugo candida]
MASQNHHHMSAMASSMSTIIQVYGCRMYFCRSASGLIRGYGAEKELVALMHTHISKLLLAVRISSYMSLKMDSRHIVCTKSIQFLEHYRDEPFLGFLRPRLQLTFTIHFAAFSCRECNGYRCRMHTAKMECLQSRRLASRNKLFGTLQDRIKQHFNHGLSATMLSSGIKRSGSLSFKRISRSSP